MLDIKQHIQRAEKGKAARGNFENTWQMIRDFVRPDADDFNTQRGDGEVLSNRILDDTAICEAEDLTSLLSSNLMPSTRRGFALTIEDKDLVEDDEDIANWLDYASDKMFQIYSLPSSNHAQMFHEDLLDIVTYGTGVLYQDCDHDTLRPTFRTFPLADCIIFENWMARVDTLYRFVEMSTRQVMQQFDSQKNASVPSKIRTTSDPDKMWKMMHMVFPRTERDSTRLTPQNMKFASVWACLDDRDHGVVQDHGFSQFPYHVSRWSKRAGEVYGRSPAWNCLPSILMVNKMSETTIVAAMKCVDPILMMPDDGFIGSPKTFPGALNVYEAGTQDRIEALDTHGKPELGLEMEDRRRALIKRAFYGDISDLAKQNVEMTAYEASIRNEDRFKKMGPMLFRIMAELMGPKLSRSYNILDQYGWFRMAPPALRKHKLLIEYISPAAKALQAGDSMAIDRLLQSGAVIANIRPEVMDHFDLDQGMKIKANALGVPKKMIRSDEAVGQIRAKRQETEQMQQLMQAAPQISQSIKNVQQGQAAVTSANAKAA